ncbi:MAG: peptidoglycan-binding lysin protein [Betaproteobacteria bacterium]|nr:peptidoglycan-binding lysin protein [Betaproteobacteria bacterium]
MRKSIFSIIVAGMLAITAAIPLAIAQSDPPAQLATTAPDRYTVVKGDTLWGIASRFLKDPYRWPDVWEPNKDRVKNPHWIFPGDVLVLDRSGKSPRIRLATVKVEPRIRTDELGLAIASIPSGVIEPFLSRPLVVEAGGLANAPKIVAAQEGHVYMARGDLAYVTGDVDPQIPNWSIYRPGQALIDPDTKENLGYEAVFLGSAKVERRTTPITMRISDSKLEIGTGDRIVPTTRAELVDYVPRAPAKDIAGKVISIYNGNSVSEAGSMQIVTVSRGARDGLERGHVLALWSYGPTVADRSNIFDRSAAKNTVKLPDERNGLVFIFRVFDKVSYGLVMTATIPVRIGDVAQKP